VLGLLGALDPYKHKVHLGQIDMKGDSGAVLSMSESKSQSDAGQSSESSCAVCRAFHLDLMFFVGDYSTSEMLVSMSTATLEEFYPAIAIGTLMRIIRDPSLNQHHTMVVQAITFIFKSLGIKCVPYISQVMPAYLHVIRTSDATFREVGHIKTVLVPHHMFLSHYYLVSFPTTWSYHCYCETTHSELSG
jgi:FKBP12-rapamycin complex-associated protein